MESRIIDTRKIICEVGCSFSYISESQLTTSLHCHSAYELIFIRSGKGNEYVGDSVRKFSDGELVFIGENLPHLYLCETESEDQCNSCSILQFPKSLFPENMENISEYQKINRLLENSSRGILFQSPATIKRAVTIMENFSKLSEIDRLLSLIKLLHILGSTNEVSLLSSLKYVSPLKKYLIDDPVSLIYAYLINNHKEEITITKIAEHVHFNPSSICRYFKQRTGKTIFQLLSEIRVEYACKLLGNSHLTVSQIAWNSGFKNQANFNKQFKRITGCTPMDYRLNINKQILV